MHVFLASLSNAESHFEIQRTPKVLVHANSATSMVNWRSPEGPLKCHYRGDTSSCLRVTDHLEHPSIGDSGF